MAGAWPALCSLAREIGEINTANGWREDRRPGSMGPKKILACLMLIVTECAEAAEEVRKPEAWMRSTLELRSAACDALEEELADVLIRTLDLADALGLNMDEAVTRKLAKNRTRGYRHGGKVA
jgi:NTP pyrophosphatase (non-canonical NTP hydrolase)